MHEMTEIPFKSYENLITKPNPQISSSVNPPSHEGFASLVAFCELAVAQLPSPWRSLSGRRGSHHPLPIQLPSLSRLKERPTRRPTNPRRRPVPPLRKSAPPLRPCSNLVMRKVVVIDKESLDTNFLIPVCSLQILPTWARHKGMSYRVKSVGSGDSSTGGDRICKMRPKSRTRCGRSSTWLG
ncbi:hypothetical protein PIB30_040109 [Stylosanthes scabra]|uniref:Uncharacterized protein n=1 Tax=Stylosanthes scabra TaxID=79078 RepID=A0ABU6REK3_9FABA|nr:hypothetical protein [Stylosanthes scabra]